MIMNCSQCHASVPVYFYLTHGSKDTGWLIDWLTLLKFGTPGSKDTGWLIDWLTLLKFGTPGSKDTGWLIDWLTLLKFGTPGSKDTGWLIDWLTLLKFGTPGSKDTGWLIDWLTLLKFGTPLKSLSATCATRASGLTNIHHLMDSPNHFLMWLSRSKENVNPTSKDIKPDIIIIS